MAKYRFFSQLLFLLFLPAFLPAQGKCLKGDCSTGYGEYLYPNGTRYVGNFEHGKPNGKGIMYFANGNKYLGDWVNETRQGKGRLILAEGHTYTGEFLNNQFDGQGTMEYANGDVYQGQWKKGFAEGHGLYQFHAGGWYEGEFAHGLFEGQGSFHYPDGSVFTGLWKENKKNGPGRYEYSDGLVYEGEWKEGKAISENAPLIPDEGLFRFGLPNCNLLPCQEGEGSYTYSDGTYYVGSFHNGIPEGKGSALYPDGRRYEGEWYQHMPNGEGSMYYPDGRVETGQWEDGHLQSLAANEKPTNQPATTDSGLFGQNPQPGSTPAKDNGSVRIFAVVVGIASYTYMPVLKYTDDDAYRFYSFLRSPDGGAIPDDQIRLLIDDDATAAKIKRAQQELFSRADDNDVILFYYSGHGLPGTFLPVDYDGVNNRLTHREVVNVLEQSAAKHKLVLADACYSGSLPEGVRSPGIDEKLEDFYQAFEDAHSGVALFLSSQADEFSLEDGGLRSGIFSYFLVRGLQGEADADQNGLITITELAAYVTAAVEKYTGRAQRPILKGNFDTQMPVAVVAH